jgi:catechol 2,3-dioxygenase-like lactoylglutathione lyase family enzyme
MSGSEAVAGDGDMSLTVLMIVNSQDRSRDFYHHVLGAEIVRDRDPVILRFHNGVIVLNVGGGPTSDKPAVTMAPPADRDTVSMALNIRVADIQAVYHAWRARGAEFLTPPQDRAGEIRCYLRDPDGYLIELGQTTRA